MDADAGGAGSGPGGRLAMPEPQAESGQLFANLDPRDGDTVDAFVRSCRWLFLHIESRLPPRLRFETESVFSDAMLSALQACRRPYVRRGTPEIAVAVLYAIARHRIADLHRRAGRTATEAHSTASPAAAGFSSLDREIGRELQRDVYRALAEQRRRDPRRCAVLKMKYWADLPDAEAARVLGISTFSYIAHYRAGGRLVREELLRRGYEPAEIRWAVSSRILSGIGG